MGDLRLRPRLFVFLSNGDRHFQFSNGTVLGMRRPALLVLALAAFAGASQVFPQAHAADFYSATLAPGADAGSLAVSNITGGNQYMLRCAGYSVMYKLCLTGLTCAATGNDSPIDADQSIDICGVTGWTQISVFRTYDGGVPSCRLYVVNPSSPLCRQ